MKEKIMPPLVLMLISAIVCALLVAANAATKDKIVQAQEDKFSKSISDTFGKADYTTVDLSIDGIDSVTKDENGRIIFEITVDGYAKGETTSPSYRIRQSGRRRGNKLSVYRRNSRSRNERFRTTKALRNSSRAFPQRIMISALLPEQRIRQTV